MAIRFAEVDREIAAGKLWRAKEILQGQLSQSEFSAELLEKYGNVLLAMHDTLEAGRFLFASGARRPEYVEPIDIFLSRYARSSPEHLISELPAMARRHANLLRDEIMSEDFRYRGYDDNLRAEILRAKRLPTWEPPIRPLKSRLWHVLIVVVLLVFLASCTLVGVFVILEFAYASFRRGAI